MIPYNDRVNEILETAYERWRSGQGPQKYETPPITRYLDDIPEVYILDF